MTMVSCRVCQALLEALAQRNISPESLIAGLPITLATLQDPQAEIEQALYHRLCDRFAELISQDPPISRISAQQVLNYLSEVDAVISVLDNEGRLNYINHTYDGSASSQWLNQPFFEFVAPDNRHNVLALWQTIIENAPYHPVIVSIPIQVKDSQIIWHENLVKPITQNGKTEAIIILSMDITARREREQYIERHAVNLQIVAEISALLSPILDPNLLPKMICELIYERFALYSVHLFYFDANNEQLNLAAGVGRQVGAPNLSISLQRPKGLVPEAARKRLAIISPDTKHDGIYLADDYLPHTRSEMAVPIIAGEQLLGVLDLQSDQVGHFSEHDRAVQQTLANQIAVVIQNARLYQQVRREQRHADILREIGLELTSSRDLAQVLQSSLSQIKNLMPYDAAIIWLKDDEKGAMNIAASVGYEQFGLDIGYVQETFELIKDAPSTRRILDELTPVVVPDCHTNPDWRLITGYEWIRSFVGAPLIIRDELVGLFILDNASPQAYSASDLPSLRALTQQISMAVENARLFEAERKQRHMAEALRDISIVLTSRLDQDDILQLVLAQVVRVLPYDAAAIWLEDGQGQWRLTAHFGYENFGVVEQLSDTPIFSLPELLNGYEESVIIPDTQLSQAWVSPQGFEWLRSFAGAPIIGRGHTIGQLALNHVQPNFYQPHEHKGLLEILATQISIAVGNARAFATERRRRLEIEALQRSSLSLTASLDLPAVLDAIIDATISLLPVLDAHIYLYKNGLLVFGAGYDSDKGRIDKPSVLPRPKGLTYTVASTGHTIIVDNVREHAFFRGIKTNWIERVAAVIGIPLKISEQVVGVMILTFSQARALNQVDMTSLQLLANQASIAIENARLYLAGQEYASLLESRVRERTAELEHERAQLQVILDGMGEGVIYDENFEVKYINQMLTTLTNLSLPYPNDYTELMRRITAPEVDVLELLWKIERHLKRNGLWRGEVRMLDMNGQPFDASVITTLVRGGSDQPASGTVTIIRDISQEKRLQAQKELFITRASHELRTPLTNIKTRVYLLQKRPDKMPDHLRVIESVTEQMIMLVRDLLDLSRIEHNKVIIQRQSINIKDLLQQVVDIQRAEAEQKNVKLNCTFLEDPLIISIDPNRMRQVFTNLVANAISYTESKGQIWVEVRQQSEPPALLIEVRDTGIGIPEDMLDQVFEPFFRASEGVIAGTGLGLSIAKEIVEAHNGTLTVSSQVGVGSSFIITLPLAKTN